MRTLAILATAALAAAAMPAQQAKPAPADGILWVGDWDEAIKEAKGRNVPIHLTIHKDH